MESEREEIEQLWSTVYVLFMGLRDVLQLLQPRQLTRQEWDTVRQVEASLDEADELLRDRLMRNGELDIDGAGAEGVTAVRNGSAAPVQTEAGAIR